MATEMTQKQLRIKYGVTKTPLKGDRIMVKNMDHDFGTPAVSVLIFDTAAGTVTSTNVYGEKGNDQRLGKGYDPSKMTHSIPPSGDEKWKVWRKRGYAEGTFEQFDVFDVIKTPEAPEAPKAEAPKGKKGEAVTA